MNSFLEQAKKTLAEAQKKLAVILGGNGNGSPLAGKAIIFASREARLKAQLTSLIASQQEENLLLEESEMTLKEIVFNKIKDEDLEKSYRLLKKSTLERSKELSECQKALEETRRLLKPYQTKVGQAFIRAEAAKAA